MRAAVIIYALFFGLVPFPGLDRRRADAVHDTRPAGRCWWSAPRSAACSRRSRFAISVFSIPMLLDENTPTRSPRWARSMALVWANLRVLLIWGAIVLGLFLLSLASGMLGLIVIYPLLGHATWHAYRAMQPAAA